MRAVPVSSAAAKRWESYAYTYDQEAPRAVSCYRHLHAEVVRRLRFPTATPIRVVDLGAGGGRLLEAVLKRFPHAHGVWVDSSPVMRVVAGRRLARFNGRVTWLEAPMESTAWDAVAAEGCDAIISSISIHHLTHEQKQTLFARMYRALRPGGVVAIADEVLGGDWPAQKEHILEQDRVTRALGAAKQVSPAWMDLWQVFCDRVLPDPQQNPTERWAPAGLQAEWLAQAGFVETGVWWEHAMWAVFGGRRAAE